MGDRAVERDLVPNTLRFEREGPLRFAVTDVNGEGRFAARIVLQNARLRDRVDQAGFTAAQRAEHDDAIALGAQPAVVGVGVEGRAVLSVFLRGGAHGLARLGCSGGVAAQFCVDRGEPFERAGDGARLARFLQANAYDLFVAGHGERAGAIDRFERLGAHVAAFAVDRLGEFAVDCGDARAQTGDVVAHLAFELREEGGVGVGAEFALHVRAWCVRGECRGDALHERAGRTAQRAEDDRRGQARRGVFACDALEFARGVGGALAREAAQHLRGGCVDQTVQPRAVAQPFDVGHVERARQRPLQVGAERFAAGCEPGFAFRSGAGHRVALAHERPFAFGDLDLGPCEALVQFGLPGFEQRGLAAQARRGAGHDFGRDRTAARDARAARAQFERPVERGEQRGKTACFA